MYWHFRVKPDTFDIVLSTTGNAPGDFTTTIASGITPPTSWTTYDEYDLSAFSGQTVYVAFKSTSTYEYFLYLDNIVVDGFPSCANPSATMSAITTTGATATWAAALGAESYDWEVVPTGNAQGTGVVASGTATTFTGNVASITGLTSNTGYDFLISSDCTDDYASGVTFSTDCDLVTTFPWSEDFDEGGYVADNSFLPGPSPVELQNNVPLRRTPSATILCDRTSRLL